MAIQRPFSGHASANLEAFPWAVIGHALAIHSPCIGHWPLSCHSLAMRRPFNDGHAMAIHGPFNGHSMAIRWPFNGQ
eukprot:8158703-Lingulodinium_polyedra.AAC.1